MAVTGDARVCRHTCMYCIYDMNFMIELNHAKQLFQLDFFRVFFPYSRTTRRRKNLLFTHLPYAFQIEQIFFFKKKNHYKSEFTCEYLPTLVLIIYIVVFRISPAFLLSLIYSEFYSALDGMKNSIEMFDKNFKI